MYVASSARTLGSNVGAWHLWTSIVYVSSMTFSLAIASVYHRLSVSASQRISLALAALILSRNRHTNSVYSVQSSTWNVHNLLLDGFANA